MGVDASADADVGVAEEFLDDDEIDALLNEQGGGRVSEVVEEEGWRPRKPSPARRLIVPSVVSGETRRPEARTGERSLMGLYLSLRGFQPGWWRLVLA
ncbi:hypothetical protein ACF1HU_36785 [Streptomyces olivaceus]|uniref:hypothetical protein n=1 Tax=Streptomyces olivaceus TaxID=47716 RepID=UPI0036FD3C5B